LADKDENGWQRSDAPADRQAAGERDVDPQREREREIEAERQREIEARRRAALARIRSFGDPVLKTKAAAVTEFDEALRSEVVRMTRLMADALGVGLAANQVGLLHRLLVYRPSPDAPLVAVVNPALEWASQEQEVAEEGCLSLPGIALDVERPIHVRVGARDENGDEILIEASGLEARILQHEIDHLDGVLILDRTTKEERKEAMRLLREGAGDPHATREAVEVSTA
jgi:peptide deformylase